MSFTASIDLHIVKGFLQDREVVIKTLTGKGFSRKAIMDRARELGLSDQFIKKCAIGDPDVSMRNCLGCNEPFLSIGIQNRLCSRCKSRR